jgi:tetratricopeptide (TPR) repeat protein
MGFFDFFKNQEVQKSKSDNINLAEELFNSLGLTFSSGGSSEKKQIDDILKQCETRQDVLNKVIELCGEPTKPRQRYLYAKAYAWSKVEYRKLAIKYLELYLKDELYEKEYKNHHHIFGDKQFSVEEERNIHLAAMYSSLGNAYEGEYEFDKAFNCYKKEQELAPFWPAPYCQMCAILIKKNELDEAMKLYLASKKSQYYKPFKFKSVLGETYTEDTFQKVIDSHISELQEKINKGYIYKPRKKQ